MATNATARNRRGTPTELVIFTGETSSGRSVEMVVPTSMITELLTAGAEAYKHCHHVGHALWHVDNNNTNFENCQSCKSCLEKEAQEIERKKFFEALDAEIDEKKSASDELIVFEPPSNWSARCNCYNGHASASGRCNARDIKGDYCERCVKQCGKVNHANNDASAN